MIVTSNCCITAIYCMPIALPTDLGNIYSDLDAFLQSKIMVPYFIFLFENKSSYINN